jgi:hypothetical protein
MAIKVAHDLGCWNALRKKFRLHTVLKCVEEATRRNRKGHVLVDRSEEDLAAELTLGSVDRQKLVELVFRVGPQADLNEGELQLLAYALTLPNAWCLCGPDEGTVRAMRILSVLEKMVSLESLLKAIGHSTKNLKYHFSERWLAERRLAGVLDSL